IPHWPGAVSGRRHVRAVQAIRTMLPSSLCNFLLYRCFYAGPFGVDFPINSTASVGPAAGIKTPHPRNFHRVSGFNCWRALQRDLLERAGGQVSALHKMMNEHGIAAAVPA